MNYSNYSNYSNNSNNSNNSYNLNSFKKNYKEYFISTNLNNLNNLNNVNNSKIKILYWNGEEMCRISQKKLDFLISKYIGIIHSKLSIIDYKRLNKTIINQHVSSELRRLSPVQIEKIKILIIKLICIQNILNNNNIKINYIKNYFDAFDKSYYNTFLKKKILITPITPTFDEELYTITFISQGFMKDLIKHIDPQVGNFIDYNNGTRSRKSNFKKFNHLKKK